MAGQLSMQAWCCRLQAWSNRAGWLPALLLLQTLKSFSRKRLWEDPQQVPLLASIKPTTAGALTLAQHMAKGAHADKYTSFIRAGRAARCGQYTCDVCWDACALAGLQQHYRCRSKPISPLRMRCAPCNPSTGSR